MWECVWAQPAGRRARRGTAAASDSCVINIRTGEGGRGERQREGERQEREGAEWEKMGGAALLRNAKHHFSSTVKNHRDADRNYGSGREEEKEGEERRGEEGRDGRSFFLQSGHGAVLLISPKSKVTQCTGTIHSTDVRVMFFHALSFCGFGCPQQKKLKVSSLDPVQTPMPHLKNSAGHFPVPN